MRIVHLATDTKATPLARSLFEQAFAGQNRWLLEKTRRGAIHHMDAASGIVHLGSSPLRFVSIARELRGASCVVVHSMTSTYARSLLRLSQGCLVVWWSGGGDYMQLLEPRLGGLLLPRTAELLRRLRPAQPTSTLLSRLRARWRVRGAEPATLPLASAAQRIDVFSVNPIDAEMLREVLPSLRAPLHTIPSFTVEDVFSAGPKAMDGPDILLGNSANPSGNHLEAFELLRHRIPEGGRIVAPLSYGRSHPGYAQAVIAAGRATFGERFEPLTGWMPIDAYNTRIARCGVVLMNHRRQQAVGNICAALYRGASVYLRRDNPLWRFFTDQGICLHAIETLEADPLAPLQALTPDQRQRNRQAVAARYGRERVVAGIRALADFERLRQSA
jgi:dTDP-N-acetylfucosamine:lipid II N-acetylfucosaminyltransferase